MARLFDITKPGKGVTKEQVSGKKGFVLFMDIFLRRFWKLMLLNILFMIAAIPAIYVSYKFAQYTLLLFLYYSGVGAHDTEAINVSIQVTPFIMLLIIQFCGAGPATAGLNYVLKKYVKDTHAWVWADFLKGFKENWKQALAAYVINTVFAGLCVGSYIFYTFVMPQMNTPLRVIIVVVLALFMMMQIYTYQLMVSFKLTLKQIYKNSFILLIVKFPHNLLVTFVSLLIMYVLYNVMAAVPSLAVLKMAFVLIMIVFFSVITMAQLFMTRHTVQKYMIDNFENSGEKEEDSDTDEDFE